MSGAPAERTIAIGELAARTGVEEGTLRMWERRYGFPAPQRLPSGHRRYREGDVEQVQRVLRERAGGMSLAAAIARAATPPGAPEQSLFAGIRARRPDLQPVALRKTALLALSHAIEDESCARAERPLLFGSFQRERFYRQSQRRWRDFARTARLAAVFADFDGAHLPAGGPAELPVDRDAPLLREWAVVCEAPGHAACVAGIELPAARRRRDPAREFEVIWSVEPAVVRTAADVCLRLLRASAPELVDGLERPALPTDVADRQLRLAAAISARTLARLG
jgi:MerR family transcriptional regulator, light-induced transcriptional regulator